MLVKAKSPPLCRFTGVPVLKRLIPVIEDRSQYRRMAHAARRRYEEKLNWMAFAAGVVKTIEASL